MYKERLQKMFMYEASEGTGSASDNKEEHAVGVGITTAASNYNMHGEEEADNAANNREQAIQRAAAQLTK